jgi:hypothetical protein
MIRHNNPSRNEIPVIVIPLTGYFYFIRETAP